MATMKKYVLLEMHDDRDNRGYAVNAKNARSLYIQTSKQCGLKHYEYALYCDGERIDYNSRKPLGENSIIYMTWKTPGG